MFIKITDSETASNKGSSIDLVHYLDKENRLDKSREPELWFNHQASDIQSYRVRTGIDNNVAKLGRNEAKFFLVNISPSENEILHLKEEFGEAGARQQLKAYAREIMDTYALNFKRPGIESSKDLVWFGKLEEHRYYNHHDPEVRQGLRKRGEVKTGEQMHVQVIVSRKDVTNAIKVSPMNNSRGTNVEHSKKVGQFDRVAFKNVGERLFDERFGFERSLRDTFRFANAQKLGSFEERKKLNAEMVLKDREGQPKSLLEKYLCRTNFLGSMLDDTKDAGTAPSIFSKKKKKGKKKPRLRL